ncbi:MAG: addiction module killer protein [Gammaproteobacteria bacterium]|nr:MAG: addiction module killer protein [Gammaproteobacteria bacterium]
MYIIKHLDEFNDWLNSIKDNTVRLRLARRLDKAARGLLGDVEPVGDGVSEMCEHFGAGWRMYYVTRGNELVIMLGGGNKSSQSKNIKIVKQRAKQLED